MSVRIYDPTIEVKGRKIAYAPRPKSLAGLRVGLVDNSKHNAAQENCGHPAVGRNRERIQSRLRRRRRRRR